MILDAEGFVFEPPPVISRARRVLIKPSAAYPTPYPVSTSREMLSAIIEGIRQVSDADILILEGTPDGEPVYPIYQSLGYNFPRVLTLDVRDCIWVEVDNPLPKPLIVPTFWVPNVILSCDYLITVAPLKVIEGRGHLSIANLLSVLPSSTSILRCLSTWGLSKPARSSSGKRTRRGAWWNNAAEFSSASLMKWTAKPRRHWGLRPITSI
ncbi:hypothetical protein ES707_20054 [subsurface metagenome]